MSEINEEVTAAVEWLDSFAERVPEIPVNWRDKVSSAILTMTSSKKCILGQLFGGYDDGRQILMGIDASGMIKHDITNAFCSFTDDWRKALATPRVSETIAWTTRSTLSAGLKLKGVQNIIIDGRHFVAFLDGYSVPSMLTFDEFARYYKPYARVQYKRGDVLKSKMSGKYFLYLSDDHVIRFENMTRHALKYWEDEAGIRFELDNTKTGDALWGDLFKW